MRFVPLPSLLTVLILALPAACGTGAQDLSTPGFLPATRWDHRPEASEWTAATLAALQKEGAVLVSSVPSDVGQYCPGYARAAPEQRRSFWVGLLSSVARYESRWNPLARGGGGKFKGLMQISDATARAHGCASGQALLDGSENLSCAVKIMSQSVARDGAVFGDARRGWLGLARDWLPMRQQSKRAEVARWMSQQSYCQ
ncbi:MAG: lytic transglycosylase domain-containing protein [Rhodobacteraceae bacterium]|nr:lytic transglycosylase domain-containing protein [Paracoccaceae bacterium]